RVGLVIRFLSIEPRLCSALPSDATSRLTPLRFANPSPSSGWIEDFHLQAVDHARHTIPTPGSQLAPGAAELGCAFLTDRVLSSQCNFTEKHLTNSEMKTMYPYPVPSSRGAFRRRSQGGERERHLRAGETQPPTPGGTRAASPATRSRPGPTTVKGIKAKMPRWRAARRGCTNVHHGPAAAGHRLVASRAQRLVGAPTPSIGGKRKRPE